jgi:hypothetical protein
MHKIIEKLLGRNNIESKQIYPMSIGLRVVALLCGSAPSCLGIWSSGNFFACLARICSYCDCWKLDGDPLLPKKTSREKKEKTAAQLPRKITVLSINEVKSLFVIDRLLNQDPLNFIIKIMISDL